MKRGLGLAIKSLASPLTHEAVDAIASSELLSTIEVFPRIFAGPDGDSVKKRLLEVVAASPRLSIPTYHCDYGKVQDLSQLDEEGRAGALELFIGEMKAARDFDADILVLHPSFEPVPEEERKERLAALKLSLAQSEERLRHYGLRVALELLPRTCLGRTPEELLDIAADFGDEFGFCLDVNHLTGHPERLAETVRALSGRLYDIHVSDYFGDDECHNMPSDGIINWKSFIKDLDAIGYDGPFTYELRMREGSPAERLSAIEENFKSLNPTIS